MGDWNILQREAEDDNAFLTMCLSKSQTPSLHVKRNMALTGQLAFSPSQKKDCRGERFCTIDNVNERMLYLNQELTVRGFTSMYSADVLDLVEVANTMNELLQLHQKSSRIHESLENRQLRLENDRDHQEQAYQRLKDNVEQCERDLQTKKEKERQLGLKVKQLTSKLKSEKEEVKRLNSVMHHRNVQYQHELKKKEREALKIKDRLHQALMDKKQEKRIGMQILNSLQRVDGKRGTWKTSSRHEEEMYTLIINNYEEKQKELRVENHQLRQSLKDVQNELINVLNSKFSPTKSPNTSQNLNDTLDDCDDISEATTSASHSLDTLSDGHFQMPYEIVKEGIEKSLKEKCRLLKEHIRNLHSESQKGSVESSPQSCDNDSKWKQQIDELTEKVNHYDSIIQQQEDLILSLQNGSANNTLQNSILSDSNYLEEQTAFADAKRLFYEQKAHFEEERKNFTEAAIRLGRERKSFEDEKASFLQQQFMHMTPFTKQRSHSQSKIVMTSKSIPPTGSTTKSKSSSSQAGPRLVPSTPNFSPAPKGLHSNEKTPSTLDLYRTIGLVSEEQKENKPASKHKLDGSATTTFIYHRKNSNESRNSSRLTTPSNSSRTSPAPHRQGEALRTALFRNDGDGSNNK
ncbi:afadin- and alpha-actinin-binding protein-like [Tubulanus polymorphus]|uniref:afadin- and alpha-actinin-binding protein-like n=1 Tax=Tubulanus polymorphus TaxID=672921 RepID=UPI003DA4936C